ncbi:MAG: DNA gyrase subunit A [Chloroflexi bacterium]|nr:DNA gyrase subunit A [Chloroflexota bacterium]
MQVQDRVRPIRIEEEMRTSYLDYAMSVIVSRALPDARDGLKPVQRRILYAMEELGLRPTSPTKKSARIVGEVLGKYHPHGDTVVYEAMVRLAQDFSLRYPLVQGQGNFGSIDNDPPAAMRYTEARLSPLAQEMLADIDQDTVDFVANFDSSLVEPTVLPARPPNLLLNGAMGIAVGMATSIPPHNLGEVCDAASYLLGHPEATVEELLKIVRGPDFPTGAIAYGGEDGKDLISSYSTGHGRVVVKARATIEEARGGRSHIVVTEIPYLVNKAALVERIALLARDRKIQGISDVRDESDREGLRLVVELRREAQPKVVLENLYKHTALKSAFFINMVALVDGQPRTLSLKGVLQSYVEFRRQVIGRRTAFQLKRAQDQAHILQGLLLAQEHLERVIALIRGSQDTEAARQALITELTLSDVQARAILDMPLRRLAALERQKLAQDYAELQKTIAELQSILADPKKVDDLIREDMDYLKKKHDNPRRTQMVHLDDREPLEEDLIHHHRVAVILSQRGYIKRVPAEAFRLQNRGGRGSSGLGLRESDAAQSLLVADTQDSLLVFTERGKVFHVKVYQLPEDASRTGRGWPLTNIISIDPGDQVSAIVNMPKADQRIYMLLTTRMGRLLKTPLAQFTSIKGRGLIAIKLKGKDSLAGVLMASNDDDLLLVTQGGQAIRFSVSGVSSLHRGAGGVRGIRLASGDQVIGMEVGKRPGHLLAVTALGYAKRVPIDSYPSHRRGSKGVLTFRLTDKTGPLAAAKVVSAGQEIMLMSAQGNILTTRAEDVPAQGRITQGVSLMKPEEGDAVISITCTDSRASSEKGGQPQKKSVSRKKSGGEPKVSS